MATETFANFPSTTVPAGASGTLVTGQADTWIVSGQNTFPLASTGVTKFHVADTAQAATSELILVTNMTGNSWSVIRGAESTTPVTHGANFTITQVIAAGWLNQVATSVLPAGDTTGTKQFLTSTGSGGTANPAVWGTITAADVPTLNQDTTGLAANVTGTVAAGNGGTGLNSLTTYAVVTGGTSTTTPLQQVASAGGSGQVLTSNAAGALPSWQNVSGQFLSTFRYAPATQTGFGINSTTPAAFGSGTIATQPFTAPPSGNVLVTMNFTLVTSAAGVYVAMYLSPAGSATTISSDVFQYQSPSSGFAPQQAFPFMLSGLTPGNSYNFDLVGAVTTAQSGTIVAFTQTSYPPTLGTTAVRGGPVVITVQAV